MLQETCLLCLNTTNRPLWKRIVSFCLDECNEDKKKKKIQNVGEWKRKLERNGHIGDDGVIRFVKINSHGTRKSQKHSVILLIWLVV